MSIPIIGPILKAGSDIFKAWNDGRTRIKEAKINAKVAQLNAIARRAELEAESEATWDLEALRAAKTSWKDEFIMLVWFAPFILLFIPLAQPYIIKGFDHLANVPYGYWVVIFAMVAHAFGVRWMFNKRVDKAIDSMKHFNP